MPLTGRAWKYGDDVNTDVIFPGKYTYTVSDPAEMARHALEDLDPCFASEVRRGDIIVAGKNFGCGSSREQAVTCLKEAGISAIIAESFSRIYFRNAVNQGLPAIQLAGIREVVSNGDTITVDLEGGYVEASGRRFSFPPFPPMVLEILRDGGLIAHLKKAAGRGE
jgi:3-isopropylmalate/(R)-2-methylmalate dehydratase small subunit